MCNFAVQILVLVLCRYLIPMAEVEENVKCSKCGSGDDGCKLLLCDGCPQGYHTYCLGLSRKPRSKLWYCPQCKDKSEQQKPSASRKRPAKAEAEAASLTEISPDQAAERTNKRLKAVNSTDLDTRVKSLDTKALRELATAWVKSGKEEAVKQVPRATLDSNCQLQN